MASTFAGQTMTKATIFEPIYGIWIATIEADSEEDITGQQDIVFEDATWTGTVQPERSGVYADKWTGRVIGGAAGWGTEVPAKNYVGVNLRAALDDLLTLSGETLDVAASDATVLARSLTKYHRARVSAGTALATLLDTAGSTFRVQRTGLVKVGAESFDDIGDHTTVHRFPERKVKVIAPDNPDAVPGGAFEGDNISFVTTVITESGLRQHLHLD